MKNSYKGFLNQLLQSELWITSGCAAATFVSERFLLPAALVIGALVIIRVLASRKFTHTPIDWGISGLVMMGCLTLIVTSLPQTTLPLVLRLFIGIGLFYAIVNWGNTFDKLKSLHPIISIFGFFLALFGLINTRWITDKLPFIPATFYQKLPIISPDTIHPSVLGYNLVILLPIIIAIPLYTWREGSLMRRITISIVVMGMFFVLVISQTRGSLLAFVCALSSLIIQRWKRGIYFVLPFAALGFILLYLLNSSNLVNPQTIWTDSPEKLSGRVEIWSRAIVMINDFPFTGVGMGLYGQLADSVYPFFINAPGSVPHAHNLFLQIAVDLGIPGLISWLSVFLIVIASSVKIYFSHQSSADTSPTQSKWWLGYTAGVLASQVALVVNGLSDSVVWGMVKPAPILWGIWGLAIALSMVHARMYPHGFSK